MLIIFGILLLGYLVAPLSGGFYVRGQWRKFRYSLYKSMDYPILNYTMVRKRMQKPRPYRFFGHIDAAEGDERLWLSDGSLSVKVDLQGVGIFTLPGLDSFDDEETFEENNTAFTDAAPSHVSSRRIGAFPQGTKIMVAGMLRLKDSRPIFCNAEGLDLLVLIYDGEAETILRRSIWSGRQKNEYWNPLTPVSLTLASFSLFILAYIFLRSPGLLPFAHIALTASLLPLSPLLPPGVLFFSLYRRIWRDSRYLRAERDLLNLPARRFPETLTLNGRSSTVLPDGSLYRIETIYGMDTALKECPGAKVRSTRGIREEGLQERVFFAFGCKDPLKSIADPFAERVLIPGNPRELSRRCSRGARLREFLGAGFFLVALTINTLLIFILLWLVLV